MVNQQYPDVLHQKAHHVNKGGGAIIRKGQFMHRQHIRCDKFVRCLFYQCSLVWSSFVEHLDFERNCTYPRWGLKNLRVATCTSKVWCMCTPQGRPVSQSLYHPQVACCSFQHEDAFFFHIRLFLVTAPSSAWFDKGSWSMETSRWSRLDYQCSTGMYVQLYIEIQNFVFILNIKYYAPFYCYSLSPPILHGRLILGWPWLHLSHATKLFIHSVEPHRVKINQTRIRWNLKISSLILTLQSSIWRMNRFVTWLRCNLGHPSSYALLSVCPSGTFQTSCCIFSPIDILSTCTTLQTNDLTAVHLGVKFSCKFTLREVQERWYALLYDPVLSK